MKIEVRDKDRGWGAVRRLADELALKKPHVVVGVTGDPAVAQHANGHGLTVVEIATKHEFGLRVPERSFVRATFDKNQPAYLAFLRKAFRNEVLTVARRGGTFAYRDSVTLKRLGLKVEGDMKKLISSHIPPPLSPATIERKGANKTTPLVLTGQMRASLTHQVRPV